jgi:hypothetical protein
MEFLMPVLLQPSQIFVQIELPERVQMEVPVPLLVQRSQICVQILLLA